MGDDDLLGRAERWIADDPDPATREELRALLSAPDRTRTDLADRFAGDLAFGTAGLRGLLGAGPNRMNRAVVARATWGLAQHLRASVDDASRPVVVGGDARSMSRELSEDVAAILAAAGFRVLLFGDPIPTPVVGFAVKRLRGAAGVVVTASHNPRGYSGYKVYWVNAAQIIPPVDADIAAAIERAPPASRIERPDLAGLRRQGLVIDAGAEIEGEYLAAIHALEVQSGRGDRRLRIAYTPLHGVGDAIARRAFAEAGFHDVTSVAAQQQPDGAFPTVAFPNPEEPGTMDLVLALGRDIQADLAVANDPDADRLAAAVRDPSDPTGFTLLSGNQIGALLGHYLLTEKPADRPRAVLTSIVSSPLLGRIAGSLGVLHEETLTGFKWISNRAISLEDEGHEFVFGFEEALGYSVGTAVFDKDGISAALILAELAAVLRARGRTLLDQLDTIARRWGAWDSAQVSLNREGAKGAALIAETMARLRASPPKAIGVDDVVSVADYDAGVETRAGGATTAILLPRSNVLAFRLASGARIIARPSGTEPKAKFYFDVCEEVAPGEPVSAAMARGRARLNAIKDAFMGALEQGAM
jgi:phosphomannomutase